MTLQTKFAAVLTLLAGAVIANAAAALWSIWLLERELAGPLARIEPVLRGLHEIKRRVEDQGQILAEALTPAPGGIASRFSPAHADGAPGRPLRELASAFDANIAAIDRVLADLDRSQAYRLLSGISTTSNVRARIPLATRDARQALDHATLAETLARTGMPDLTAHAALLHHAGGRLAGRAGERLLALHELIERMEGMVVETARLEVDFGRQARGRVLVVLVASIGLVALAMLQGVTLVRRWILRPVEALRSATGRLAAGDFSTRLPVIGKDELALLSGEVNHMAAMISHLQEERVERERLAAVGEMVQRIAHNLRNPLAGIRSLAELTQADSPPDSPTRDAQARIIATVDRFEAWLRELLSISRPLSLTLGPRDVASWLGSLVEPLSPLAQSLGVRLEVDTRDAPATATFDPGHLEQALVGLITNAIQASASGESVRITAAADRSSATWELRIADQGPGVPDNLRAAIFRPYFTTKRDGTGIGLAVARQVVEQHRGRIWVETGPEGHGNAGEARSGAVFVVRLPLDPGVGLANTGQLGASSGQNPGH